MFNTTIIESKLSSHYNNIFSITRQFEASNPKIYLQEAILTPAGPTTLNS
jgi:hypothetical protein